VLKPKTLCFALAAFVLATPRMAAAQTPSPAVVQQSFEDVEREVVDAKRAAFWSVMAPAGAGALVSMITKPGGKTDVPIWQVATIGGLFGVAATWGVSMGYYQSGQAGYATFSGLTRSALLGGALFADAKLDLEGAPVLTLLTLAGVVTWDILDYNRLDQSIRERAYKKSLSVTAPLLAFDSSGLVLGLVGQF
jgi:hypothetical protein